MTELKIKEAQMLLEQINHLKKALTSVNNHPKVKFLITTFIHGKRIPDHITQKVQDNIVQLLHEEKKELEKQFKNL